MHIDPAICISQYKSLDKMKRLTRKSFRLALLAIITGMAFTSCSDKDDSGTPVTPVTKSTGIDPKNLDQSVRPADNFYQYANGGWMKNNPLPAAYSRYGSFEGLIETNKTRIKTILEGLQSSSFASG